jgi:2-C-methyl-D-erythritol 2,4-cyclodiphosphate synthase
MRIGHGFDIHRFVADKPLMLGGIHIPFAQGMLAHSDGDVVLHALCDALLGAAALGDIGRHFPDTDPKWKNTSSHLFVRHVIQLLSARGLQVQNVDITIIAEVPKLAPYIEQMCENVADMMAINRSCVNIKATTMEKLGPIGAKEAIGVHAVALLGEIICKNE